LIPKVVKLPKAPIISLRKKKDEVVLEVADYRIEMDRDYARRIGNFLLKNI